MTGVRFALLSAVAAFLVAASLVFADRPLAVFFHAREDSGLGRLAAATTDAGKAIWYVAGCTALLLLLHFFLRRRRETIMAAFVITAVVISGLLTDALKVIVGRPRPKLLFEGHLTQVHWFKFGHDWNSFPSGHSTTVAAVTAALCLLAPRWSALFVPVGTALIATRVITTAHYLSDTLLGTYLGVVSTVWIYRHFRLRGLVPGRGRPDARRVA